MLSTAPPEQHERSKRLNQNNETRRNNYFVNKQRQILNHQNMPTQINDEKQKIKQ